jgi:hypothetical protein
MARPSKLTPQLQETFVAALRAGAWFSDACRIAGVKKSTAHEWHRRGRGEDPRPPTPAHVAFAQAVDAALAERGTVSANGHLDEFAAELTRANQSESGGESGRGTQGHSGAQPDDLRPSTQEHPGAHSPIADALRPSAPQRKPAHSRIAAAFAASSEQGDNRESGAFAGPGTESHAQAETPLSEGQGLRPTTPQHGPPEMAPPGDTGDSLKSAISADDASRERWERLKSRISEGAPEDPFAASEAGTAGTPKKGEGPMEIEVTIRIPVGGATLTIPTREKIFEPGLSGRVVDSIHVAAVDSLRSVELVDGRLLLELKGGEKYAFPVDQLLDGGKRDAKLEVRENLPGPPAAFGGLELRERLHEIQLARVASLRLVEPESSSTPERWSEGGSGTASYKR